MWNEAGPEDEVLAMVVRTGLCTTMGNMLRQVTNPLHNTKMYRDPYLRVRILFMVAIVALLYPARVSLRLSISEPAMCIALLTLKHMLRFAHQAGDHPPPTDPAPPPPMLHTVHHRTAFAQDCSCSNITLWRYASNSIESVYMVLL